MNLNQEKVEEAVLAVLWLTLHDTVAAWKPSIGLPWIGCTKRDLFPIQRVEPNQ
jgi:hypothetical protein